MRVWILALLLTMGLGDLAAQELVRKVQMYRDRHGDPGEAVGEFRPQDRRQHFHVELGEMQVGNRSFQVRYIAQETTDGNEIEVARADFDGLLASEITTHVELPQDWPLGRYRLEVLMEDRVIGTHPYIVTPTWAEQIVGYWSLHADRDGEAGDEVERFRASQRTLHFQAQTSGYIRRGARLSFQLLGPDGAEVNTYAFAIEPDSPVFNILTYQVSLPENWPSGRYRVQLLSGRRLLGAHEFEIVGR